MTANTKRLKSAGNKQRVSNKELIGDKQRVFQKGGEMNDKMKEVPVIRSASSCKKLRWIDKLNILN